MIGCSFCLEINLNEDDLRIITYRQANYDGQLNRYTICFQECFH
jgi:hypothetical protein